MKRSLFVALFVRLLAGFAVVAMLWLWLPHWWIAAIADPIIAVGVAWWCSQLLAQALLPLELAAEGVCEEQFFLAQPTLRELDGLAEALGRASVDVSQLLAQSGESRRELEALLDSMQDAVVAVDAAGRIQWTNQPMRRLIPGAPASGTVRVGHSLVHTIRDPDVLACVGAALAKRTVVEGRATSVVPGKIFDVNAAPMPQGGAVAVLRDVTRVEQMERAQKDFVANVSHELRTPLTSITGYVETLLEEEEPEGIVREFLGTIQKNAVRMNRLTEDLLVLARVESGEHPVCPVRVKAALLVQEAYDSMARLVRDSGGVLKLDAVTDLDVMADSDAVVRVLSNLIENATKYGRGETETRIVVSAVAIDEAMVRFSVQDFGAGIPSEHIGRLFERFYRVDKGRSRESGGTGLGLAIARRLTEAQKGKIWVESELSRGSTFFFTLPAAAADDESDQLGLDLSMARHDSN
jgi:two-component system phosphate regulon sensor histidine kinase PhoR